MYKNIIISVIFISIVFILWIPYFLYKTDKNVYMSQAPIFYEESYVERNYVEKEENLYDPISPSTTSYLLPIQDNNIEKESCIQYKFNVLEYISSISKSIRDSVSTIGALITIFSWFKYFKNNKKHKLKCI